MSRRLSIAQVVAASQDGLRLQDVCRALNLDLKGQTSASYNMRLNYEKTLLEFENYLSSGQYSADVAAGTCHCYSLPVSRPSRSCIPATPGALWLFRTPTLTVPSWDLRG